MKSDQFKRSRFLWSVMRSNLLNSKLI